MTDHKTGEKVLDQKWQRTPTSLHCEDIKHAFIFQLPNYKVTTHRFSKYVKQDHTRSRPRGTEGPDTPEIKLYLVADEL